jgi:DNA modification methylase
MINLLHGDCLELMKSIPDKSIDMVLTDPPYGTTACKWDVVIPFEPMWEQLKRITKDNGAICLFGSEPFSSHLRLSNLKMFKYDLFWNKRKPGNPLIAKHRPLRIVENISVFCKSKHQYFPQMIEREKIKKSGKCKTRIKNFVTKFEITNRSYSKKFPVDLLDYSNASQKDRFHPTQKPVSLLGYLIKTYTLENETVLDFTMGSGSTGVACKNINRNFIGIEKDEKYFEIAKNRINNIG